MKNATTRVEKLIKHLPTVKEVVKNYNILNNLHPSFISIDMCGTDKYYNLRDGSVKMNDENKLDSGCRYPLDSMFLDNSLIPEFKEYIISVLELEKYDITMRSGDTCILTFKVTEDKRTFQEFWTQAVKVLQGEHNIGLEKPYYHNCLNVLWRYCGLYKNKPVFMCIRKLNHDKYLYLLWGGIEIFNNVFPTLSLKEIEHICKLEAFNNDGRFLKKPAYYREIIIPKIFERSTFGLDVLRNPETKDRYIGWVQLPEDNYALRFLYLSWNRETYDIRITSSETWPQSL